MAAPAEAGHAPDEPRVPPDPDAYDSPRAVQARARGLAAPYIAGGEDPDFAGTQRRERRYLRWLLAMVVVVVLAGFVLGAIAKLVEGAIGGPPLPTLAAAAPSALAGSETSPSPTQPASADLQSSLAPIRPPVLGALEDGVPNTLDGVPVIHGSAIQTAGEESADAAPFLIGGWFHAVANVRFCTFFSPPRPVDACHSAVDMFVASNTKLGVTLAAGVDGRSAIDLASTTIRPVVLRVHTHDALCVGEFRFCRSTIVLDEVAWLGAALDKMPPALVEMPLSTSFSRHDALAKARRKLGPPYELKSISVVRDTTAEGIQFGPVSNDPWVWWLKYRIPGTGNTAVFVYDYRTGKELLHSYGTSL